MHEYSGLPFLTWSGLKQTLPVCSVDYLRAGGPRVWYSVQESDAIKLETFCEGEMHRKIQSADGASKETIPCNNQSEANCASCVLDDIAKSGQFITHVLNAVLHL